MTAAMEAQSNEIRLSRLIDAPRELVWRAWTDPAHLPRWWGPRGFSCVTDEIDIRPGGAWRFSMIGPDGTAYRNRVAFREIVAPERIDYTIDDDGAGDSPAFNASASFAAQGDKTRLTIRMAFDSAATRDAMTRFGAVEGGESTLDCLSEHVAAEATGAIHLVLTRMIDAPRELVWQAWTVREHAKHWGPKGFTVEVAETEVRPGAAWRARLRPDDGGRDLWQGGVYREVVEPERLVFTFAWDDEAGNPEDEMVIALTLEDVDGKTKLTLHQVGFATVASRDGHAGGWGEALASLAAHVAGLRGGAH